ncbi:MAG: ATP-binding protein [Proteobacteria bacterium]|nr:ATP-binding protein [Pseudomonadota bacterium]
MRGSYSLQRQLGVGLAVGIAIMWVFATLGAGLVVRHELDEAFDSALQETAQRILPLAVIYFLEREDNGTVRTVAALGKHEEFLTYLVRDVSGNILMQSHDADLKAFPDTPSPGFHETATHRLYGEAAISNTIFIEVAEPLAHRREATLESVAALLLPLLIFGPLSLIGVWWFVRRSMRPIVSFKEEIEARGGSDLSAVAATAVPDEIRPVAEAVNTLLDRLRRTLEAERSFTANSAHELRTPIAATLAQTQRLIAELSEAPLLERARQIENSLRALARLAEKLLQLAKAEGGGLLLGQPQNLSNVLFHIVDEFKKRPDGDRLILDWAENRPLMSHLDPDAFGILVKNLVENAFNHGDAGAPISVSVHGEKRISVVNHCPIVPPDALAKIKGRFERDAAKGSGSGLGLAIADAIATGAGGKLQLLSPATNQSNGFEALVDLP